MRKTIPQQEKVTCDFTGKEINGENYLSCSIDFHLMFLCLETEADIKQMRKDEPDVYSKEDVEAMIHEDAHDVKSFSLDLSEDVAIEVYKFLKRKYPKQMKSFESNNRLTGFKLVKSGW